MGASKADILKELLNLASQIPAAEKCVDAKADTDLNVCPSDSRALKNIADKLSAKYGLTFPTDVRSLGTIEDASEWIFDNKEQN
jgi:hypothetical protein